MRLKYQLFLALLFSSIVLITLMAVYNSWSFNKGFTNYVVENEKRRQYPIVEALEEAYSLHRNWDWIKRQPGAVHEILRANQANSRTDQAQSGGRRSRPDRPPPKIVIADSRKQVLFGAEIPASSVAWLPVQDGDTVVGYLGIREPKGLPGELERAFIDQQQRSYGYAAVATVMLSALFAFALAWRIVRPILTVSKTVGFITNGDYQHRIDTDSQDEIGDLSRNINKMALTLERNQQARQQWMAEISHELRTPVAVLRGELEALQDGINKPDRLAIDSLHTESVRLGRLIDDLHDLSMSDLGALNYQMESIDLREILEQRLQASRSLVSQAELSVHLETGDQPMMITADPQRITQLIDNILQNSIRYTDPGGEIAISLMRESDMAVVECSDSAPGVSEEQLPNLFKALYRAEKSRSREHGGSGLGLAIAQKIVDAHQGDIQAYPSDKGGLRIRVQLPL